VNRAELNSLLKKLIRLPYETEWVEFKEAKNQIDFNDLGRYFAALSNEANLNGQPWAWLILGVTNTQPRHFVGTSYRHQAPGLERLKQEIAKRTNHQLTLSDIFELKRTGKRILLLQIPPAPRGVPTTWDGIALGRIHDSLGPLSLHEIERIRRQVPQEDWSSQTVPEATMADLDPKAIAFAKEEYRKKHPNIAGEAIAWDDEVFLNKVKVCIGGKITRTALILLGRNEAEHFLSPAVARITWILKDAGDIENDFKHFGPPLILAINEVYAKVRNLIFRYLPDASLFPVEITKYDPWVIRETLHNCIVHQDYSLAGRINVIEEPDSLLFTNMGEFLPGSVEAVIKHDAPPEFYRNRFLVDAMVNFGMIDSIGSGIKRMFTNLRARNFPMPDYDLSEPLRVKVRIIGKVIDEKYTRILMQRTDLDLMDIIALDKVQKGKPLTEEEFHSLKTKALVEGRRPNLYVSARIAAATDSKADYIKRRAFDKAHYKDIIIEYLRRFSQCPRQEIEKLLLTKLSDALQADQKRNFIRNLLQEMRREGMIRPVEGRRGVGSKWELFKSGPKDSV